jgi:hypothetical protein
VRRFRLCQPQIEAMGGRTHKNYTTFKARARTRARARSPFRRALAEQLARLAAALHVALGSHRNEPPRLACPRAPQ